MYVAFYELQNMPLPFQQYINDTLYVFHIMTPQMAYFWTNDEFANSNFLSNVTYTNSLDAEIPYRTLSEVTYDWPEYYWAINHVFISDPIIRTSLRKLYHNEIAFTYNDIWNISNMKYKIFY